ncbi:MAG: UDP-2,3-diacylglucosamine diphosphatase [Chlorobi bacterium]|nr:UDP-2,3-diacylglucosamine diphosphatase [Chlorobiota bacterium]
MNKPAFFVSDLHFGLQTKEKEKELERKFVSFLEYTLKNAGKLYILGDLFDYWFEYRRVIQKGYFRTFTALQNLTEAGIEVHYLIGNHDFMHRDFFEDEIGLRLHQKSFETKIGEKRFFLGHGDGLIANDYGYLILKKILRNKFLQWFYSLIHPDFGIWIASLSSKTSRNYTEDKDYGEKDSLFEFAKKKIDSGFDYVIFGHTHVRKFREYKSCGYINLGTWLSEPCYGKYFENKFEIIDW